MGFLHFGLMNVQSKQKFALTQLNMLFGGHGFKLGIVWCPDIVHCMERPARFRIPVRCCIIDPFFQNVWILAGILGILMKNNSLHTCFDDLLFYIFPNLFMIVS